MCREHGQQLAIEFAANPELNKQFFGVWTLIKETGVDDAGLMEFHNKYFKYDTYRDEELAIYKAMGNRKIGLKTWNPFRLYRGFKDLSRRLKEKSIDGNLVGEGLIQGGVLIFDKSGKLCYAYEEDVGNEFDMKDIVDAALAVKAEATTTDATKSEL